MLAALENGVKGGKWYSLMDKVYAPGTLEAAWQRVQANAGAHGIDRTSVEVFAANAPRYLTELSQALRTGSYVPQAVRRVNIPEAGGGQRPLGIPTVKDRVVQAGAGVSEILCVRRCETFSRRRKMFSTYRQTRGEIPSSRRRAVRPV